MSSGSTLGVRWTLTINPRLPCYISDMITHFCGMLLCVLSIQQSWALQWQNFCRLWLSVLWLLKEGYVVRWGEDNLVNPTLVSDRVVPYINVPCIVIHGKHVTIIMQHRSFPWMPEIGTVISAWILSDFISVVQIQQWRSLLAQGWL